MTSIESQAELPWAPSVYHAESIAHCGLEDAWKLMLNYRAWNPNFAGAKVTLISGQPQSAGELNLIQLFDSTGVPVPEFFAATVKVTPPRDIVWYVYPKEGNAFCNFVHFWLEEVQRGVRFTVYYYAQYVLTGEALI